MIDNLVLNTSKSLIITKHQFFGIVITCFKIIQTLQVEGVLELSGDPLEDEHRYFTNSQKKSEQILMTLTVNLNVSLVTHRIYLQFLV